jgi:peroxiredoxin Q/BCP
MNRATLLTAVLALTGVSAAVAQTPAAPPTAKAIEVGAVAPDFELSGATRYGVLGAPIRLSDFKGKTVILAFFPKARTQGCTIQLRAYRDKYNEVFNTGQNTILIAISADPAADLASWAKDDQFPFLLASDEELKVATVYGALATRGGYTNRNLFIVGPDGKIAFRATPFREVDPTSYTELANEIKKTLPQASSDK